MLTGQLAIKFWNVMSSAPAGWLESHRHHIARATWMIRKQDGLQEAQLFLSLVYAAMALDECWQ